MLEPKERDVLVYEALTSGLKRFWQQNHKQSDYLQQLGQQTTRFVNLVTESGSNLLKKAEDCIDCFVTDSQEKKFPRLEAITTYISETGKKGNIDKASVMYYPLKALELSNSIFPQKLTENKDSFNEYKNLWDKFIKEHNNLLGQSFKIYLESLPFLLHKYTWCIPAIVRKGKEIKYGQFSLYEQSRITAALIACLCDFNDPNQVKAGEEELLLIEGDISGIQKFIYNPTFNGQELQDGIARRLRGRSFYLNLLLKTITDYLIGELNLYNINVLWATGGHFLIIAPNTEPTKNRLKDSYQCIQKWLWKEFHGALSLIIADLPVKMNELKDFSKVRANLGHKTTRLKLQQFAIPLELKMEDLTDAWQEHWLLKMNAGICRDTGQDLSENEIDISKIYQKDEKEIKPRSLQSLSFDSIGRVLIEAKTIQLRRVGNWEIENSRYFLKMPKCKQEDQEKGFDREEWLKQIQKKEFSCKQWLIEFGDLNRSWLLTSNKTPVPEAELCLQIADHNNSEINFLPTNSTNKTVSQGFEFLADAVAIDVDKENNSQIRDFHKLANNAKGASFLGVLRMDVDNLGYLFDKGFPVEERSIAKIANLSRTLDMFFTGYLNTLVGKNIEGKERNLYTTYAGGDDLFIVGAWNEVIDLAETINEKFEAYCGGNTSLHISGGIAMCKGKYPIGKAAEEAGELLDSKAKDIKGKNAIAFMNKAISWNDWGLVRKMADQLVNGVIEKKVSHSFIYSLLALYRQHIDSSNRGLGKFVKADLLLVPKFLYSLARNVDSKEKELICEFQKMINMSQPQPYLPNISIIAGYAALKTQSSKIN